MTRESDNASVASVNFSPRRLELLQNYRVFFDFRHGSALAARALHMKRAWLAAAALGAGVMVGTSGNAFAQEIPVPAWAPAAGAEDVVVLKDGGAVRGTVMEVLPNDHVSVKLADGRTATIAWSVVHHIEQAAKPAAPTTTPAPAPTPQVVPQAPAPVTPEATGSVHVTMEGDGDAVLEQDHGGAWAQACSGSCGRDLPLGVAYRITGSGVKTSGSFRLLGKPGDHIVLHLNTASSAAFSGGVTMAVLGGLAATIGFWGTLVANGQNQDDGYDDDYDYQNEHHTSVVPWVVTTLVGAAVGTVGLVMAVSNEKTKVTQSAGTADKAAMLFGTKGTTAMNTSDRAPTWANLRPAGVPAADTGTIFSFKF